MINSKIKITFTIIVLIATTCLSQEKNKGILPLSIYQTVPNAIDYNTKYYLNKRLDLSSFKFVFLDFRMINEEPISFPMVSNLSTPSKYIYDSYNKYTLKQDLQKSFFKVSDLYKTRERSKK